ncbi:MAG: hypothetical protein BroJett018_38170 [Chloroflexota bacterium]|nr:hypothetical protein [Chloroflexota bacterium]NOG64475.1 hypothetical protein [Chloroflexota bacterium]GIK66023.1 MAG: hypothetical protein BroJett018_38170 [Chloroflexota bacterium]
MLKPFLTIILCFFAIMQILPVVAGAQDISINSFTSCSGKLSFDYPENWVVEESRYNYMTGGISEYATKILLANGTKALEGLEVDTLAENAQTISINITPPIPSPIEIKVDPFDKLANATYFGPYEREFGPVRRIEVNDWPAARRDYVTLFEGLEISGIWIEILLPDDYNLTIIAETYSSLFLELDANVDLLISSLSYYALKVGLSVVDWDVYFEPKCTFHLAYPADWIVSEAYSNQLIFFNSQAAQDTRRRRRDYKDDQLEIEIIQPQDLPEFFEDIGFDATDAKPDDILMAYAEAERLSVETPIPFTVGEHNVLRADFRGGFILLYDFGEGQYAILAARSSEDGFAAFEETILQIAGSVQYNPIQEDEPSIEMTPTPTP